MENLSKQLSGNDLIAESKILEELTIGQLRERFTEVMGYSSRSRNRLFLVRKILWGMQAEVLGDISEEARKRANELADERDVITRLPKISIKQSPRKKSYRFSPSQDSRLPVPGSVLIRQFKGEEIRVIVGSEGFEYQGEQYSSLSAIAKKVTGSSYNGFLFFKLK